jgi:hypothetical protein
LGGLVFCLGRFWGNMFLKSIYPPFQCYSHSCCILLSPMHLESRELTNPRKKQFH